MSKQFCFIRCRRQHLQAVENTVGNSPQALKAKFLGKDGLFCFIRIYKFGSFKNSFATIMSLSELSLRFRGFILLIQTKKISMNYGSCKSIWKPWRWKRLDPIIMMRDIYINPNLIPLTKFNSSNRTTDVLYGRLYEVSESQLIH